jgi:CRISPR/Cas system CMR subunit Cmr4 (Cas7 group RAMP superfamily)
VNWDNFIGAAIEKDKEKLSGSLSEEEKKNKLKEKYGSLRELSNAEQVCNEIGSAVSGNKSLVPAYLLFGGKETIGKGLARIIVA